MGLDMYAYTVPAGQEIDRDNTTELTYWRMFNALHGWMEDLYRERGGEGSFNCIPMKLTDADLDRLLVDLKANNLTPREGFLFGEQKIYEEDLRSVYTFVASAKCELAMGRDVYYDSWW